MQFKIRLAVAAVAVAGSVLVAPAPALAAAQFQVVNRQSEQCLSVQGGSRAHAANVIVDPCDGTNASRLWRQEDAGRADGYQWYYFKAQHTGMCLNVVNFGQLDGTDVVQAVCSDSSNEQWRLAPIGTTGWSRMISRNSRKCLDKAGNGDVVQWRCWTGDEWWQHWRLAHVSG